MKRDMEQCLDCSKFVIVKRVWEKLAAHQRRDERFSIEISGRCVDCYREYRALELTDLRTQFGYSDQHRQTFCGCGCWIFIGENCPNCEYELLNKENAA